mmetsp:Transcript_23587/g.35071  ORF Transcript_23587/g.35071 Transcript_23587/m.35071 type:complete len:524 (-) Transcript_23587:61-1632(-)|eukprot:CAMPEP_0203679900 /NCGR_PEP_ID=MMETSP0090-20130426/37429_1 /ASSEMBLY_ACC=CAM_ASM_001088 /TAXON_ID=426623 /ORGANISM="Chaetoceros affinis, Strain CCMP159" /LENGTH=523 /DNA_ID=CAMNT_0050547729 /DNA_START=66 /DNA_END=1637 /DNA_ORIENTATION=-
MKIRLGPSVLLLLQARAPTSAFSSSLSASIAASGTGSFGRIATARQLGLAFRGGATGSGAAGGRINYNGNSQVSPKATVSPEETALHSNNNNRNDNDNSSSSSGSSSSGTSDYIKEQIIKAAHGSKDITGPSTFIDSFAGKSFVNTSKLQPQEQKPQQQHRVLFVLGGPGAGKGTQSANIVSEYKCIHLSVGELLRKERLRGDQSPHAELIEKCLVAGQIVPVEISLGLVRDAMDEAVGAIQSNEEKGENDEGDHKRYGQPIFLVDGFPRNYDNLSGWTTNMPTYASCIGSLVYDCPMDVLEQRILSRAETSGRSDDNLESARKRFTTFQQQTMPVVYALEEVEKMQILDDGGMGRLHIQHIAGEGSVEDVWDATKEAMNGYITNDVLSANKLLLQAIETKNLELYSALTSIEMMSSSSSSENDEDTTEVDSGTLSMDQIEEAFKQYELTHTDTTLDDGAIVNRINNADVEIRSGTKVIVSYDRRIEDKTNGELKSQFRESRVWSHESKGWTCIHFVRKPLLD